MKAVKTDIDSIQDRLHVLMGSVGLDTEAWLYYCNGSIQIDGDLDLEDLKLLAQVVQIMDKEFPIV